MKRTKTLFCGCEHSVQDEIYGDHLRLHNWADKAEAWRCTVCGNEKKPGVSTKKDDKR